MQTLKINSKRWIALGTLSAVTFGTVMTAQPAQAKSSTWKKVAIGAGIATGYGLLKGKGKIATIGGIATVGSYYMYKKDKKKEEQQDWQRNQRRNSRNYRR